jgi:hypothetical protein
MSQSRKYQTYRTSVGLKEQLERIELGAEEAQRRVDFDSAHDEEILLAIKIVEDFLRLTGRVCYGGAAMNAQLPTKYQFYDPRYNIPDYDFLTATPEQDIEILQQRFRSAGFTDIGIRPGMHEGTTKVYINFVPVADISAVHPALYNMFKRHAVKVNGLTFMDVNSLRMMMYLELSRPRGEVKRWAKVYERILLLAYARPIKTATCKNKVMKTRVPLPVFRSVLQYALRLNRVIAGASVVGAYRESLRRDKLSGEWFFGQKLPLILYVPAGDGDLLALKELLGEGELRVREIPATGDFIPKMTLLSYNKSPIVLLVEETACHSYNTLELRSGKMLRIASLDTLITLYLSILISDRKFLKGLFPQSILCMAQESIELSAYMRRYPDRSQFPFISLTCSGHQKGLPTLLREKVARIRAAKTQKTSSSRRNKTRR